MADNADAHARHRRRRAGRKASELDALLRDGASRARRERASTPTSSNRSRWPTPVSDYDMKVYRDGVEVGSFGQGTTNFEQVVLATRRRASTSCG